MTRFGLLGSLTSYSASTIAFSWRGLSATWRSMTAPAGGLPTVSQLGGTVFQVCLARTSSQGGARGFAKLWMAAAASTKNS